MTFDDEAALVAELARELTSKHEELTLRLEPISAFRLAGLVQLALDHQLVADPGRDVARRFLDGVRAYLADCPAALEVLRRGDQE